MDFFVLAWATPNNQNHTKVTKNPLKHSPNNQKHTNVTKNL